MGRKRNPQRDESFARYADSGGKITLEELAKAAGVPKARISKWKSEDKWEERLQSTPKKRGGQKGNKNARGRTPAKDGNRNAVTHGAFASVTIDDITPEEAERIRENSEGGGIQQMREELRALYLRRTYLENILKEYTEKENDCYYTDKIVHMVVPKGMEELMQEQDTGIDTGTVEDAEGSKEKFKTAMKTIIKSSPFERAMKVEAELNRLHGRIIKQLDSIKTYEMEQRRLSLEERKYSLMKQKLTGIFDVDEETGEIIDEMIGEV